MDPSWRSVSPETSPATGGDGWFDSSNPRSNQFLEVLESKAVSAPASKEHSCGDLITNSSPQMTQRLTSIGSRTRYSEAKTAIELKLYIALKSTLWKAPPADFEGSLISMLKGGSEVKTDDNHNECKN